jgi:hypothetical protein
MKSGLANDPALEEGVQYVRHARVFTAGPEGALSLRSGQAPSAGRFPPLLKIRRGITMTPIGCGRPAPGKDYLQCTVVVVAADDGTP